MGREEDALARRRALVLRQPPELLDTVDLPVKEGALGLVVRCCNHEREVGFAQDGRAEYLAS